MQPAESPEELEIPPAIQEGDAPSDSDELRSFIRVSIIMGVFLAIMAAYIIFLLLDPRLS